MRSWASGSCSRWTSSTRPSATASSRSSPAGRHLLALVEDLLDLSGAGADRLELAPCPVDVEDEIEQAVALCGPLAAVKSLHFNVEARGEKLWALADRRRLKQVLLNLISNAINYNRPGGTIK